MRDTTPHQSTSDVSGLSKLWLIVSMTIAWGANWPFIKIAVSEIPVFTLRFIALTIGALGLFALAYFRKAKIALPWREIGPLFAVALGNVTFWHLFSALGVARMGAGHASILGFTMPLWVVFIAALWGGERVTWLNIIGLIIGMSGLGLLLYPDRAAFLGDPSGPLSLIAGAVAWAFGTVGMQRFRFSIPTISVVAWQLLLGALPLLIGAAIWEKDFSFSHVSRQAFLSLAYMGLIATIYGNWAWFKVVSIYPAFVASMSSLAIPVVGVVASTLLLGEPLGFTEIAALLLLMSAIFLVLIFPKLPISGRFRG